MKRDLATTAEYMESANLHGVPRTLDIAVNARFLLPDRLEGIGRTAHEVVRRMADHNPRHRFHLLFDRPWDDRFTGAPNITPHHVPPPARHPLLWHIWFQYAVRRWLHRHRPDVFFSPDGFLCEATDVPTVLTVHDLAFEHMPDGVPPLVRWFYRRFMPRFTRRADRLIAVSHATRHDLVDTYGLPPDQIAVIENGVDEAFQPLPRDARQAVRDRRTNGRPFLLALGSIHPRKNIVRALQAFDVLAREDPDLCFVLTGAEGWRTGAVHDTINTLYHGDRLLRTGHLPDGEVARLLAAADALVYVARFEGFGLPVVEALVSGTPAVIARSAPLADLDGQGAHTVDPLDVDDIARGIREARTHRVDASHRTALRQRFDWDEAARRTMDVVLDAADQSPAGRVV